MTSDATPDTPVDPRALLNAAIEHAPKTVLSGPLADLVIKEMRNGVWWLDKTETIRPKGDLPEIAFDAVYADKARAVLALPVVYEGALRSQASGTPSITPEQATALYLAVSARDFQLSFDDKQITTADIAAVFRDHGIDVVPGPSPHDIGWVTI